MSQEESEMGRFKPKGGQNEPHEPFLPDGMSAPGHEPGAPLVAALHVPKAPITKENLSEFLIELRPIIESIEELSRTDQHLVGEKLQDVKNLLHAEKWEEEMTRLFEEIVDHFNQLLVQSRPIDQEAVLKQIQQLQVKL